MTGNGKSDCHAEEKNLKPTVTLKLGDVTTKAVGVVCVYTSFQL